MSNLTMTITRDRALAIIQQAIGPELAPVLDFLISCEVGDVRDAVCGDPAQLPKAGSLWRSIGNFSEPLRQVERVEISPVARVFYVIVGGTGMVHDRKVVDFFDVLEPYHPLMPRDPQTDPQPTSPNDDYDTENEK